MRVRWSENTHTTTRTRARQQYIAASFLLLLSGARAHHRRPGRNCALRRVESGNGRSGCLTLASPSPPPWWCGVRASCRPALPQLPPREHKERTRHAPFGKGGVAGTGALPGQPRHTSTRPPLPHPPVGVSSWLPSCAPHAAPHHPRQAHKPGASPPPSAARRVQWRPAGARPRARDREKQVRRGIGWSGWVGWVDGGRGVAGMFVHTKYIC